MNSMSGSKITIHNIFLIWSCLIFVFFVNGCGKPTRTALSVDKVSRDTKTTMVKKKIAEMQKTEKMQLEQSTKDIEILKKRNPFNPHAATITSDMISPLSLTGIIWHEKGPTAIINDMIVNEGDMIGEKRVKAITENAVILIEDGKEYILRLK